MHSCGATSLFFIYFGDAEKIQAVTSFVSPRVPSDSHRLASCAVALLVIRFIENCFKLKANLDNFVFITEPYMEVIILLMLCSAGLGTYTPDI